MAPASPNQMIVPALSLEIVSGSVLSGESKGETLFRMGIWIGHRGSR